MTAIPRARVAAALCVDEAALPPGDLPLDRLAGRFLAYLRASAEDDEPRPEHPDFWTYILMSDLADGEPALGLAAVRAALALAQTPEEVALIAAGPLEDLLAAHGTEVIGEIEALAVAAPRFAYALTGVWQRDIGAMLWARVEAARRGGSDLDDGAPLPPPDGL